MNRNERIERLRNLTHAQRAASLGCTVDQLIAQYRRNLADLKAMLEKANRTGKKVNNYTAGQLEVLVARYEVLARGE